MDFASIFLTLDDFALYSVAIIASSCEYTYSIDSKDPGEPWHRVYI